MLTPAELGTALAAGASIHLFVLRSGDWDLAMPKLVRSAAAAPFVVALLLTLLNRHNGSRSGSSADGDDLWAIGKTAFALVGTALLGLYASMLAYRVSPFHRLHRFPGPLLARVSNFYLAGRVLASKQEFSVLKELHEKYGDVVRIGA